MLRFNARTVSVLSFLCFWGRCLGYFHRASFIRRRAMRDEEVQLNAAPRSADIVRRIGRTPNGCVRVMTQSAVRVWYEDASSTGRGFSVRPPRQTSRNNAPGEIFLSACASYPRTTPQVGSHQRPLRDISFGRRFSSVRGMPWTQRFPCFCPRFRDGRDSGSAVSSPSAGSTVKLSHLATFQEPLLRTHPSSKAARTIPGTVGQPRCPSWSVIFLEGFYCMRRPASTALKKTPPAPGRVRHLRGANYVLGAENGIARWTRMGPFFLRVLGRGPKSACALLCCACAEPSRGGRGRTKRPHPSWLCSFSPLPIWYPEEPHRLAGLSMGTSCLGTPRQPPTSIFTHQTRSAIPFSPKDPDRPPA